MSDLTTSVVLDGLTFSWPDGSIVIDDVSGAFTAGHTALIGRNGTGKSTLLRLVAGELTPTSGSCTVRGSVGYLPQRRDRRPDATVADALGLSGVLRSRTAVEGGSVEPAHYDVLEGRWDLPERQLAQVAAAGLDLGEEPLCRPAATLSGGEWATVRLLGLMADEPEVLLLDEPTNDLDADNRHRLYDLIGAWTRTAVVVSHDRTLLDRVDAVAEVRGHTLTRFGGTYSEYQDALAVEQAAADRCVRVAEDSVRREKRQWMEAQEKLTRRTRYAATAQAQKRVPKILANSLKRQAQVSAAKLKDVHARSLDEARTSLSEADWRAKRDEAVRIELPGTAVPPAKVVASLVVRGERLTIRGPERIAVVGPNGSGKTTLIDALLGRRVVKGCDDPVTHVPWGYLDQHLSGLDECASALENVRRGCPATPAAEVRAQLARLLVRGDDVHRPVGTLSGGERFRVALTAVLLAEPAPKLLVLDEPTNNLDLATVEQLAGALDVFSGAMLVASHDEWLLDRLGATTRWRLAPGGIVTVEEGVASNG
jgi:ATPase subunit of ABC transporter with duplicated ATPase domains